MSDLRAQIAEHLTTVRPYVALGRGHLDQIADAVMAVVGPEIERLRTRAQTAEERLDGQAWEDLEARAEKAETERDHLQAQLAELTDARQYEYCHHGHHVTMNQLAQKIAAKLTAEGQRAEAVEYARAREAEVRRVRALCEANDAQHPDHDHLCPDDILAAIDQPQEDQ